MGRRKKSVGPAPRAFGDGGGARLTYLNTEPDGLGYDDDPEYRELVRDSEPGAGPEWWWGRGFGSDVPALIRQKRTFSQPGKVVGTIPGWDVPEGEGQGKANFYMPQLSWLEARWRRPAWAGILLPESTVKSISYAGDLLGGKPWYGEEGFDPSYLYSKLGFMNDITETALGRAALDINGAKYVNDRWTGVGGVPNPNEVGFIRDYVKDRYGSYMPYSSPEMQRGLTERDFENELVRRLAMQRLQSEYREGISSGGAPTDRAGWVKAIESLPLEEQVRRAAIDIGRLYGNEKAKDEFYTFMRTHPGADIERALSFFLSRNGVDVRPHEDSPGGVMRPWGGNLPGRPKYGDDDDDPYVPSESEKGKFIGWTKGEYRDYELARLASVLAYDLVINNDGRVAPVRYLDNAWVPKFYNDVLNDDEYFKAAEEGGNGGYNFKGYVESLPEGLKKRFNDYVKIFQDEYEQGFARTNKRSISNGFGDKAESNPISELYDATNKAVSARKTKGEGVEEKMDTSAVTNPIDTTNTALGFKSQVKDTTAVSGIQSVADAIKSGDRDEVIAALDLGDFIPSDKVQEVIADQANEEGDEDKDKELSHDVYVRQMNEAKEKARKEIADNGYKPMPANWSYTPTLNLEPYHFPLFFSTHSEGPGKPAEAELTPEQLKAKERQEKRDRRQARLEQAMRLAPVAESVAGLFNPDLWRPDYRNANMLLSYRDRPPQVRWDQRADYYRPHWYPVENDINRLSGETAANMRSVAALNPGNAVALNLFNNYNAAKRAGEIRADAMKYNNEQTQLAAQINNQINQSDATGRYQAQAQNGQFRQSAAQQNAANWREGVRMRDEALTAMNEGRGTQLASAASNLAAYANEAQAIRSLGLQEWLKYKYGKGGFGDPVYKGEGAACGGRLRAYGGGDDETYYGGEIPAASVYWEPDIYVSNKRNPRRAAKDVVRHSGADFIRRHLVPYPDSIPDWEHPGWFASAKLSSGDGLVYPNVQNVNGTLVDFTDPSAAYRADPYWRALATGDAVGFRYPENAEWFAANNYKRFFPSLRGAYREARRNGELAKRGRR